MARQELKTEILSRGGSLHTNEKRDVTIRVRTWTKDKLKTMGASGNDNDDIIFTFMLEHEELEHLKRWLAEDKRIKPPHFKSELLEEDKRREQEKEK